MKVLIEAIGIDRPGGTRSAALDLIAALPVADAGLDLTVLLTRPEPRLNHVRQIVAGPARPIAQRIWLEAAIRPIVRRVAPDRVHHVKGLVPLAQSAPYLTTFHDLGFLRSADLYPSFDRWYWRTVQPHVARRARRIVAVSAATRQDTIDLYGVPADRVVVNYSGVDDAFHPRDAAEVEAVRARYGLPAGYLLHVGSISRKKNVTPLIRAMRHLPAATLALVGRRYHSGDDPAFEAALAAAPNVISLGVVPPEDLPAVVAGASIFVFPSRFEGFGIAPVEAARSGVPVIAWPRNGLVEALGDALYPLRDPTDEREIAAAIDQLRHNASLRAMLRDRALTHTARFTWPASAANLARIYRES